MSLKLKKTKPKHDPVVNDVADLMQYDWLHNLEYNPAYKPEPPEPVITIQGNTILTPGNYMTISGKPKAGKTAFISALIASALTGANVLGLNTTINKTDIIAHFDTEQGEYEYYQNVETIKTMAEINILPVNFKSYKLRGKNAAQIKGAINYIIVTLKPKLVIIDGLLDAVIDFNDINECKEITDYLKQITDTTKTAIVCIIHQSRANNYTMGHLGSFADRYSQSVLEVVKDNEIGISSLKPVYLRSAGGFEPINIYYNINLNKWCFDANTPDHHKADKIKITDADLQQNLDKIILTSNTIASELNANIIKVFKVNKSQTNEIVKRLFKLNLITKEGSYYAIKVPY